jgi:hypothetical protein
MNLCGSPEHAMHRRAFLGGTLAGLAGTMGLQAAEAKKRPKRRVLFIWLAGGSSQFETWDPKPGRATGGPFRSIQTTVPGYRVCELMPKLAARMEHIAVIRSLNTGISEHEQAANLISAGRPREPVLDYPEIGVVMGKELAQADVAVPDYVSLFTTSEGRRRPRVGFLGAKHAPLLMEKSLRPEHITLPEGMSEERHREREGLRETLSDRFARGRAGAELVPEYNSAFRKVRGLMRSGPVFDLEREPARVRERYGKTPFGEQALLARRLLEAGASVVKVARGFWDSHHDNFESHRELVPDLDHVMSALLDDLKQRGMLSETLVIVLSEFGRTPEINKDVGRDHYAAAWSVALAGAGVKGGAVYGKTDADGKTVAAGQANASDLAATIYSAAGLNLLKEYQVGPRPVPIVKEDARPIEEVLS